MHNPQPQKTLCQRCIHSLDAVGQAVFRPAPWKLPAALSFSLALPDVGLRLWVASLAIWFALRALPGTESEKTQLASQLATRIQVMRAAKWICVTSAALALIVIIVSIVVHSGA